MELLKNRKYLLLIFLLIIITLLLLYTNKNIIIIDKQTSSLNIKITKNANYYLTHIWSDTPYLQLNKYASPEYGTKLYKPSDLLKQAISNNNLDDEMVIGFNASGFYLKDKYDKESVKKSPELDKTSVGTVIITDGVVIRNNPSLSYKDWYISGIDESNQMLISKDYKTTNIIEKREWSDNLLDTKIRNTLTFASPLILDGKKVKNKASMPKAKLHVKRQALCQIDENNYLLITGKYLSRNNLINIMLENNCQTGMNLDGGGSIALLYKDKNSKDIKTIIGDKRKLPEVAYFSELK